MRPWILDVGRWKPPSTSALTSPPREGVKPFYAECSGHGFTLPLHDTNSHGPPCISTLQQMRNPFPIHPSYTKGENSVSYNQQLGVATHIP